MSSPPTMGIGTSSSSRGTPAPRTRMLTQFIVTRLSWGGLPGAGAQPASSAANDPRRGPMHVIFWVGPEHGGEGLGEDGEGDVAVPAGERAALEVGQAEAGFQLAVVVLDPPPDLGQADQLGDGGGLREVRQPVASGLAGCGGPFGQQPAFWQAAVVAAGDVAVGGADPDGQETAGHRGG